MVAGAVFRGEPMRMRNGAVVLAGVLALPAVGVADTLLPNTKTFAVTAQIVAGCGLVGTERNFGLLDFGTQPAVASGRVSAGAQGSVLQIECTPGTLLRLAVDGGLQPGAAGTQRNLQGPGGALIAYRLYVDASLTQALGIGQTVSIPVSGVISLPIYGALDLPGGTSPAGTYTDTAQVTVSY